METIINPFTGRKLRTNGPTFKKVMSAIVNDPLLLYDTCDQNDPYVFAINFAYIESLTPSDTFPPYDPNLTRIVFKTDGKWEHMTKRDKTGYINSIHTIHPTTSLFTSSVIESKNECYMATLDTCDDWDHVDQWRIMKTRDGYVFDFYFLLKTITNQLNEIKNGNAFPVYPTNPFTNIPFTRELLMALKSRIKENDVAVAAVLTVFLRNPDPRPMDDWIVQFEAAGLRYYLDFAQDSSGYWDLDTLPASRTLQHVFFSREEFGNVTWIFGDLIGTPRPSSYYWNGLPYDHATYSIGANRLMPMPMNLFATQDGADAAYAATADAAYAATTDADADANAYADADDYYEDDDARILGFLHQPFM